MTRASARDTVLAVCGALLRRLFVVSGATGMTLGFFLVLPLMQVITKPPEADLTLQSLDTADIPPPPPPPPEEEPEEEPEPEEPPPELAEEAPPLDLTQLEALLTSSLGDGLLEGDFVVKLDTAIQDGANDVESLFSEADLDQKPRAVYQPSPVITAAMRKKTPATVTVLFVVGPEGKVDDLVVQKSTDPAFERAALSAVKQWRFEPGKRKGTPVRFRMRVPITFAKE